MVSPDKKNLPHSPTFIVIGAMKAGTSSFHYYLSKHPDIFVPEKKELNYFINYNIQNKGIEWYKSNFVTGKKVIGEVSPNYSKWPESAEMIYNEIPDAKIIYLLRDPIMRAYSQLNMHKIDINEFIRKKHFTRLEQEIINNSRYNVHLKRYLNYFPKEKILIIQSEKLSSEFTNTMKQVFDFLGVSTEKYNYSKIKNIRLNTAAKSETPKQSIVELNKNKLYTGLKKIIKSTPFYKPLINLHHKVFYNKNKKQPLNNDFIKFMKTKLSDDIKELRQLTGIEFIGWLI